MKDGSGEYGYIEEAGPKRRLLQRSRRLLLTMSFGMAVAVAVLASFGAFSGTSQAQEAGSARNVILFIGDGLGAAQRDAIQLATVGPYEQLTMDSLPYTGMAGTNSVDPETFVTDSAASGTAMSSGIKTVNGAIGVDPEGNAVPTVLEQARTAGKSTGLVSTGEITDASPAAFASHVEDRDEQTEIARQYIEESRPDVLLGGGENYWYPEGNEGAFPDNPDPEEEDMSQSDQGNLVEAAQESGYEYVTNADELAAASGVAASRPLRQRHDVYGRAGARRRLRSFGAADRHDQQSYRNTFPKPRRFLLDGRGRGDRRDGPRQQRRTPDKIRAGAG